MHEGPAALEKSLILDYISVSPISSLLTAWNNGHWVVIATNSGSCLLILIVGILSIINLNVLTL